MTDRHPASGQLTSSAAPGHISTGGDPDPGGSDRVAGTVDDAITVAAARQAELASDTYGQGSTIGDLVPLPPPPPPWEPYFPEDNP